jgi:16S rRNA A1518/A1519 N6-dimethyltransferase RsmA/KsgA/DIM1 with predicted DNA glycosylase/AP lyase activity
MMAEYTDLSRFKAIYIVDLCRSLCEVARKKLAGPHFKNVHVIEGDACTFSPEKLHVPADLITYSYSLSSAYLRRPKPGDVRDNRCDSDIPFLVYVTSIHL